MKQKNYVRLALILLVSMVVQIVAYVVMFVTLPTITLQWFMANVSMPINMISLSGVGLAALVGWMVE